MTKKLHRAACLGLLGSAWLAVAGCTAAVDADAAESEDIESKKQAYSFNDCAMQCESDYNDGYYQCQIQLGNWMCWTAIQNRLNDCLGACPPCDYAGLTTCQNWCESNLPYEDAGPCFANCSTDYCG